MKVYIFPRSQCSVAGDTGIPISVEITDNNDNPREGLKIEVTCDERLVSFDKYLSTTNKEGKCEFIPTLTGQGNGNIYFKVVDPDLEIKLDKLVGTNKVLKDAIIEEYQKILPDDPLIFLKDILSPETFKFLASSCDGN